MATISRSLSKMIVHLFITMGVVAAFVGVDVGIAAADEVSPTPVVVDPTPDPIATDPVPCNNFIIDPEASTMTLTDGPVYTNYRDYYALTITPVSQCGTPIDVLDSILVSFSFIDEVTGLPVEYSYPPLDSQAIPGLPPYVPTPILVTGPNGMSDGTILVRLFGDQPGTYDMTVFCNDVTMNTTPWILTFIPAEVPFGTLSITGDAPNAMVATATVTDDQGQPGGFVRFTITGNGTFVDGQTETWVFADTSTGIASAPIYSAVSGCDEIDFTVSGAIMYADSLIPLDNSPIQILVPPSPQSCGPTTTLSFDMAPTNNGTIVYANGTDSWTGTVTLTQSDGTPITGVASEFLVAVAQAENDLYIDATNSVAMSDITDNGDGTYTVLFTTTTPGDYIVAMAWNDVVGISPWITFAPLPTPPVVSDANQYFIAGSTEPGAIILISDSTGETLGIVMADDQGHWSMPTPEGTASQQITVNVVDWSRTVLASMTTWLDTDSPEPPRVDVANASQVSGGLGAAEPFATIFVTFPDETTFRTTAEENGTYSIATPADMIEGVVRVVQADTAGNQSSPTVVDLVLAPVQECWYVSYVKAILKLWFWWL